MASWADEPKPEDTDTLAYAEAWENRIPDVEYADEDEQGQLGLGVPGEQRAIPSLAKIGDVPVENIDAALRFRAERPER